MISTDFGLYESFTVEFLDDGIWRPYASGEHRTLDAAQQLAGQIFGGQATTRIIRISRTVVFEPCTDPNCPNAWVEHDKH